MEKWVSRAGPSSRLVYLLLLAALLLLAIGVMAPTAFGFGAWQHRNADTCGDCHLDPVFANITNASCQQATCHVGFDVPRAGAPRSDCWSCHAPGQAMAALQAQAGCIGVCHFQVPGTQNYTDDETPHGATPHYASTIKNCRTCHTAIGATGPHHDNTDQTTPVAASCTTCHPLPPADPVDGAANGHGDLGVGITDCAHCHVGMTPDHPTAAGMVIPRLTVIAVRGADVTIRGTLKRGTTAIANATGWVQWKGPADTTWDVSRQLPVTTSATGAYTATVTAPLVGTAYRVVFEGIVTGSVTVRPALRAAATNLTLRVAPTTIRLSRRVRASGTVTPARTGANVTLTIQRRNANGRWVRITVKRTALNATGGYSTTYRPGRKGTFRIQARIAVSGDFAGDLSPWRTFRVR